MIELKNLKKTYGERTVLDIPQLTVADGCIVAFAGANGSGKTTLLKILAGTLAAAGEIKKPKSVRYMPQQSYAFRGDLIRNLTIGGAEKAGTGALLEKVALAHLAGKQASSLSGGELQRLSLCRVLSKPCDLLLLDEPTSACDAKGAELVVAAIRDYQKQCGCTVLLSTHSPSLALQTADRLIVFNNGRIESDGPPKTLLAHPGTEWAKSFVAGWKIEC